jgi:hypothetical protein
MTGGRLRCYAAAMCIVTCPIPGCSAFASPMETITIVARTAAPNPPGRSLGAVCATVVVNGQQIGKTPLIFEAPRRRTLKVEVHKPGFATEYRETVRELSRWGNIDSTAGVFLLVPFLGLLTPGAWEHHPNQFDVRLYPEDPERAIDESCEETGEPAGGEPAERED